MGNVKYLPDKNVMVWYIKQFQGQKEFIMTASFGLPSICDGQLISQTRSFSVRRWLQKCIEETNKCRIRNSILHRFEHHSPVFENYRKIGISGQLRNFIHQLILQGSPLGSIYHSQWRLSAQDDLNFFERNIPHRFSWLNKLKKNCWCTKSENPE